MLSASLNKAFGSCNTSRPIVTGRAYIFYLFIYLLTYLLVSLFLYFIKYIFSFVFFIWSNLIRCKWRTFSEIVGVT